MKMPCKLRREGWKEAVNDTAFPEGVEADDMVDVIFWNTVQSDSRRAAGWVWGWSASGGVGFTIRYWRFTRE